MNVTLNLLKKRPVSGISAKDFPRGYRLSGQIYKLRKQGYEIETIQRQDRHTIARYRLIVVE